MVNRARKPSKKSEILLGRRFSLQGRKEMSRTLTLHCNALGLDGKRLSVLLLDRLKLEDQGDTESTRRGADATACVDADLPWRHVRQRCEAFSRLQAPPGNGGLCRLRLPSARLSLACGVSPGGAWEQGSPPFSLTKMLHSVARSGCRSAQPCSAGQATNLLQPPLIVAAAIHGRDPLPIPRLPRPACRRQRRLYVVA